MAATPEEIANLKQIPAVLRDRPQWVGFKIRPQKRGKLKKTPYIADAPGTKAKSDTPETWRPFSVAVDALKMGHFDCIAYCLNGKGLVGIDLDDCVVDGEVNAFASDVIRQAGSYAEYSASGTGVHILVRGELPGTGKKFKAGDNDVELYSRKRFWICTGRQLPYTPESIEEGQAVVDWLLRESGKLTEKDQRKAEAISSASLCPSLSFSVKYREMTVEQVIRATLPSRPGERNDCVLKLARGLRFNANLTGSTKRDLKTIVRRWHKAALPNIDTKDFASSWADFLHAWDRAKMPLGVDLASEAWGRLPETVSGTVIDDYDSPPVRRLVALLRELVLVTGSRVIWLSTRKGGELLGVSRETVSKWLNMLVADEVLEKVTPGNAYRSTRYRWLPKIEGHS